MTRNIKETILQIEKLRDDVTKSEGVYHGTKTKKLIKICNKSIKDIIEWTNENEDKSLLLRIRNGKF